MQKPAVFSFVLNQKPDHFHEPVWIFVGMECWDGIVKTGQRIFYCSELKIYFAIIFSGLSR
jgi:hypothetical protein